MNPWTITIASNRSKTKKPKDSVVSTQQETNASDLPTDHLVDGHEDLTFDDLVMPRGIRIFCPNTVKAEHPIILSTRHQNIVNKLFSPYQLHNIKFRQFKTVWEAAGGSIIDNQGGSSHHVLITKEGIKVAGAGFFTKGMGTIHGISTVKYLQAACLFTGIWPTPGL